MTDTTPTPTARERERIDRALQKAFAADPMDRMLQDYRPMTAADILRFDVHWLGPMDRPGRIEPRYATDRMKVKPLRILRGFLHRLDAGFNTPERVRAGGEMAGHVTRPGHGFVTQITSGGGIVDGTGRMGGLAWNQALRRLRDGTLRVPCSVASARHGDSHYEHCRSGRGRRVRTRGYGSTTGSSWRTSTAGAARCRWTRCGDPRTRPRRRNPE